MTDEYRLRKILPADIDFLFALANDPEVRRNSINTSEILYQEHCDWFMKKINSATSHNLILEKASEPVGQIRFEFNDTEKIWEIGYSITSQYRGKGLGKLIIQKGIEFAGVYPVCGYVKEENKISQSIFNSLGFSNEGIYYIKNCPLIKYVKRSAL